MAVDLPAVVIEADTPTIARPLTTLGERDRRALAAHSEATGLRPIETPRAAAIPIVVDPERAARRARIEEALREARGPLDLGDRDAITTVRASVAAAYVEARAHPEDPEAPFLVGEALRMLGRVEELAGDPTAARALRDRADLIDGGRRLGLSEGGPSDPAAPVTIPVSITLLDATSSTTLFIDGERRDPSAPLSLAAGEHHLRVVNGDAPIAAQWLTVSATGPNAIAVRGGPPVVACSTADLGPALSKQAFAIGCPRWMRIVRREGALDIRVCSATSCGPSSTWSTRPLAPGPPPVVASGSLLTSKWTWIGVGAAAVIGGTIAAWRLGAFERDEAPPKAWRWEGVR